MGTDLSPLFLDPKDASVKNASFSQFPNCGLVGHECMALRIKHDIVWFQVSKYNISFVEIFKRQHNFT